MSRHAIPTLTYINRKIVELLYKAGGCLIQSDERGFTALHHAVVSGQTKAVQFLLDKKAAIDAVDHCGNTPLHHAAALGHVPVQCLLMNRGASLKCKNDDDLAPVDAAIVNHQVEVVNAFIDHVR